MHKVFNGTGDLFLPKIFLISIFYLFRLYIYKINLNY